MSGHPAGDNHRSCHKGLPVHATDATVMWPGLAWIGGQVGHLDHWPRNGVGHITTTIIRQA
jgi:hypothetical protein